VALWGDEFYKDDPATKTAMIDQTINSMNKHSLDFTIFADDTKNGSSLCTDQAIGQDAEDIFKRLKSPTLYTLGDNEWTYCHRTNNGSYVPIERLGYLRMYFCNKETTQNRHPIKVERQGAAGEVYSENSRFVSNNVEFVAVNIVGSNNSLVVSEDQCYKKSERGWDDCDAATVEYQVRNAQNAVWLKDAFEQARSHHYAGILIDIQADIYFPFALSGGGYAKEFLDSLDANNSYTDFFKSLAEETHNYAGQVLLVHGDSHYFKLDKAMVDSDGRLTPNFIRI